MSLGPGAAPEEGDRDEQLMRLALAEARKGVGRTSPNPAVGAVIVKDGQLLASGFHRVAGSDHAEVAALRELGMIAEGAELYSTLEPCNHFGRTGPCTEAIIKAGIRRVIFGSPDPNPRVRGRGQERLEQAGIVVRRGVLEAECTELNEAFNFAIVAGRPFVVMKAATSLDGRIATRTGNSRWITQEAARLEAHQLRNQLDAVLVGVGTVLADDPELSSRIVGARNPIRIVLDSRLRTPKKARLVETAQEIRTIIVTTAAAADRRAAELARRGIEILRVKQDREGRVALLPLLTALHELGLNSVLVEGGSAVHGAFVDQALLNKVVFFVAPLLIGGAAATAVVGGTGARRVKDALRLERSTVRPVGPDWMLTAYPAPPEPPKSKPTPKRGKR